MKGKQIALKVAKIGLLGDSSVGKSSICQSYAGLEFNQTYLTTIGSDKYESKFTVENGKQIKLIIWDTAGQERFRSMALNTIKSVNGIVLVADLTNKDSFDNIKLWLQDINDNFDNPCLVLFGNKSDLKEERVVSSEEAKKYAEENKLIYFETSAKTSTGIKEGFAYIANQAYKKAEQKLNSGKSKNIEIGKDEIKETESSKCCGSKKNEKKKNENKNNKNKKQNK
jgi:small GTP-binding protein